jgi:hypothetical protein
LRSFWKCMFSENGDDGIVMMLAKFFSIVSHGHMF